MKKSIGNELVEGFEELTEALEAGQQISDQFTVRRVQLDLHPEQYSPQMVVRTRNLLRASQAVFAAFIGVRPKTLQAWEQGANPVTGAAARLMDEIRANPRFFRERLKQLAKPRVS